MAVTVSVRTFTERIQRLYAAWNDGNTAAAEGFPPVDAICVPIGSDDTIIYCKSYTLETWLLGYEIQDVLMVFNKESIHFVASKKKIDFLRPLEQQKENSEIPHVKLHVRNKDGNNQDIFEKVIASMKKSGNAKQLGFFAKDKTVMTSSFIDSWNEVLKEHDFENIDISVAMASLLSLKDEHEFGMMKKASQVTLEIYQKYVRDKLMTIIDNDQKVEHSKLSSNIAAAVKDKKYIGQIEPDLLDMCYPPIVQSGGKYSIKFSASSDNRNLKYDVIITSFGVRYQQYCANIARTLLVNPHESVTENYNFLTELHEHLCISLKSGVRLCDVYNNAIKFATSKNPDLVGKLTKNFGFATGIEFREGSFVITSKTTLKAQKSQVYNLCVGLIDVTNNEIKNKDVRTYSLFIGDTVSVNEESPVTILTPSKKKAKNVSIVLKEDDDSESEDENESQKEITNEILGRGKRTAVLESKLRTDPNSEEKRKIRQKELAAQLNEEALQRLAVNKGDKEVTKVRKSNTSYKNVDQIPNEKEVIEMKIFVDKKMETVLLPIWGLPVPFHIATIKNVSQSIEGDHTYLRINFFHPGATLAKGDTSLFGDTSSTYLKELTFRASNLRDAGEIAASSTNLNTAFRLIKEVQKKYKAKEAEQKEREDLVTQDTLKITNNKTNPRLKDLFMRPTITTKKMSGALEAHVNGFRYTSIRGDKVDILYNNIKHAFFQPCDGEMFIALHFHLKNAIMFGKKKHLDVQFYTEVGENMTDLSKHQHMHDRDDLAAEQSERDLRNRLKAAFKSFCDKVENVTKQKVEFDSPFRDLGFNGSPYRSTVLLQPTSGCLVNLTEWPPFVITLEDVELVHFERVQFQLKNFDMVFVFKDYAKKVVVVSAIPMNMLDHVKEWLNQCDIVYTEGIQSLNWAKIMKTIVDDPEGFFAGGGWKFLEPDSDESAGEEDSEDEDQAYQPTDEESEEASSEDDSAYEDEDSEESDDSEEALDSEEESGKDWSDLEEEAKKDDLRKNVEFTDEYTKSSKSKSKKGGGGSSRRDDRHHKNRHSSGNHKSRRR